MRGILPTLKIVALVAALVTACGHAFAQAPDQAAALVMYPYVAVDTSHGLDTVLHLSNTSSTDALQVHCVYADANSHCDGGQNAGQVCQSSAECSLSTCRAGFNEVDFDVVLTRDQPLAWRASEGLQPDQFPCLPPRPCPDSNLGSAVPPSSEDPFVGTMLCYATDNSQRAVERNDLTGEATIERYATEPTRLDVAKYNAIGLKALPGTNNGDDTLVLGGPGGEYEGCPNFNVINHVFDGATDPVLGDRQVYTTLVLMPCTYGLGYSPPTPLTLDFFVVDEFEQRYHFFASAQIPFLARRLSTINPIVFNAATVGSLVGRIQVRAPETGLLALAIEEHVDPEDATRTVSAAVNVHVRGTRLRSDYVGPKPAICGDSVIDPGEGCDDGNTDDTDCCSATCQPKAAGQACADDSNTCTQDQCDGQGACVHPAVDPLPAVCGCCRFTSFAMAPNACVGDCDGDGTVTTLEVETCRKLNQGKPALSCATCDANGDALVDPFEIALASDNQRYGCPAGLSVCGAPADEAFCEQNVFGTLVSREACDRTNPASADLGCPSVLSPTPTPTPITATPTPTVVPCAGDCNGDRAVTINDLFAQLNIALGYASAQACPGLDRSGDEQVTVVDVIAATRQALEGGCPATTPAHSGGIASLLQQLIPSFK